MANLCCNSVYLLGNPNSLSFIANTIKTLFAESEKGRTTLELLQEKLDFKCEGWGRSYDTGLDYLDDNEIETGKLLLSVCTAWNGVPDYWNALCDKFNLSYASMEELDSGIYIENDCEKRYFPNDFRLECWDYDNDYGINDEEEFDSKESLLTHLTKVSGQVHSFDEWCEILDDEDIGSIIEYERDGEQARIIL